MPGSHLKISHLSVALAAAAVQLVTAVAGLIVARSMEPAAYGQVAYFFSLFGMVVLLAAFGLSTQVTTEVATLVGAGRAVEAGGAVLALGAGRLATALPVLGAAALFGARGDGIAALACLVGAVALLSSFVLGAIQGMGYAWPVAAIQFAQAGLYLVLILRWAKGGPSQVFAAAAASNVMAAVAAAIVCGLLIPHWSRPDASLWRRWRSFARFSGQAYAVSLVLSPLGALAILTLGKAGRFADAASMGVALPLALLLPTTLAMVVMVQIHPRMCQLRSSSATGCAEWIDLFYRPFALLGIVVMAVLIAFPREIIATLFTAKYLNASGLLIALAGAALMVAIGQLLVWMLVAYGRLGAALAGGLLQLLLLALGIGVTLALRDLPFWLLGVAHVLAAVAALAVWGRALKAAEPAFRWRAGRLLAAAVAATVMVTLVRHFGAGLPSGRLTAFALPAAGGLTALLAAGPILLTTFPAPLLALRTQAAS